MSSKITMHYKRMSPARYAELLKRIDAAEFRSFYLSNANDDVCRKYEINLSTVYRLLKDLDITYTEEERTLKNSVASSSKIKALHGVESNFRRKDVQRKIAQTNKAKYGVENVFSSREVKEKARETNLRKLDVEFPMQAESVKEKRKAAVRQKFGVDCAAQAEDVKVKIRQTNMRKYGVECSLQAPEVRRKAEATLMDRYGVAHFSQTEEFASRRKAVYKADDERFDSLPELALYLYALDRGEQIIRSPICFEYEFGGVTRRYFPDFEYQGRLVEIKGDQFFDADGRMINPFDRTKDALFEAKHQCGLKNGVEFWTSERYGEYLRYFAENYDVNAFKNKV